ncbi:hypothetical protein [Corynebacterium sp. AOP12-C2-36]|uniref:hypothetical protein n=1 Tax=Corynebacterium sp. AOP12-C2-36 TaxID=3457723 RepID=UPI0040340D25
MDRTLDRLPATTDYDGTALTAAVSDRPSGAAAEITVTAGDVAGCLVRVEPSGELPQSPFADTDGVEPDNAEELARFTADWIDGLTRP